MITTQNLTKTFGGRAAVSGLGLTFESGRIYGLVGTNGAGKSTLLRMLCGIYRPNAGSAALDGEPIFEHPASKERIVLVPDDLYFLPGATLEEMARFYRESYPRWNGEKFERLLGAFPLERGAKLSGFSKGMRRQAALILALAREPDYLLLDEAFDGAVEIARRAGLITDGDLVVLTAGVPLGIPGTTNLIKVALAGYCLVQGRGLSGGRIVGNLCVAKNAPEALRKFKQDDILVVPEVERPIWGLLDKAAGIIIESDTLEPEAADLLRRREIPVIIGARGATTILRGGISVGVDASQGLVYNAASLNNRKPKGEE